MKNIFTLYLIILASLLAFSGTAENNLTPNPALQRCKELFNHANTYYWYGRYTANSLAEFNHAKLYLDSTFVELAHFIPSDSLQASEANKIKDECEQMLETIKIINVVCLKTISGRVPLFRKLTGETKEYVFGSSAAKKGLERALKNTLALPLNIEPLSAHMFFSIVLVDPVNPVYEEIAQQCLNNNTKQYIVSRYELRKILDNNEFTELEHGVINPFSVQKIMQFFQCNQLGVYSIKLNDETNLLYYWGTGFNLWKGNPPAISSGLYAEGFSYDKSKIFPAAFGYTLLFVLLCIILMAIAAFILKKHSLLIFFISSLAMAFIIGIVFFSLTSKFAPESSDLYSHPKFMLWRLLLSLGFVFVPAAICFFIYNRFWKEKSSELLNLFGMILGSMIVFPFMFVFHSFMVFENLSSALPVVVLIPVIVLFSYFLANYFYTLFLGKTKDKATYYIISIGLFFISLSLLPAMIVEKYTIAQSLKSIGYSSILFLAGLVLPYINRFTFSLKKTEHKAFPESLLNTKNEIIAYLSSFEAAYIEPSKNLVQKTAEKLFESSDENKVTINIISASRGSGKTRLIQELRTELSKRYSEDVICFFGDCDEFQDGNSIPYEPFVQALGSVMGVGRFKDEGRYSKVIGRNIVKSGLLKMAGPLTDLLGFIGPDEHGENKGANVNEITSDILKLFEEQLNQNPKLKIIFILDDVQWMDATTLALFAIISRELFKREKVMSHFSFLLSERPDELTNDLKNPTNCICEHFLKENKNIFHVNRIIYNEDLVNQLFFSDFIKANNKKFSFEYLSEKKLQTFFLKRRYVNPIHVLQTLISLIDNDQVILHNGELKLNESTSLENLPVQEDLRKLFQIRFEKLDPRILRLLISASFIGEYFEASMLASIWNMDRLELLYLLKEAEDLSLIVDKSELDDVFAFTSKAIMAELRRYYLKSSAEQKPDEIPQVIKEYHLRIINAFEKLKGEEIEKYDLELLCSIAKRTYINRGVIGMKAIRYNQLAGERCQMAGRISEAMTFFEQYFLLGEKFLLPSNEMIPIRLSMLQCCLDMGSKIEEKLLLDDLYKDSANPAFYVEFILLKSLYLNRTGKFDQVNDQLNILAGYTLNMVQNLRKDFLKSYSVKIGQDKALAKTVAEALAHILDSIPADVTSDPLLMTLKGELLNTIGGIYADKLQDISGLKYLDERLLLFTPQSLTVILSMDDRRKKAEEVTASFNNLDAADKKGLCFTLNYLGRILFYNHQFSEAPFFLQKAFEVNERFGDKNGIVMALSFLGQSALEQHDYENSYEYYRRSYAESYANLNLIGRGFALEGISRSLRLWKETAKEATLRPQIDRFKETVQLFLSDLNVSGNRIPNEIELNGEIAKWG